MQTLLRLWTLPSLALIQLQKPKISLTEVVLNFNTFILYAYENPVSTCREDLYNLTVFSCPTNREEKSSGKNRIEALVKLVYWLREPESFCEDYCWAVLPNFLQELKTSLIYSDKLLQLWISGTWLFLVKF